MLPPLHKLSFHAARPRHCAPTGVNLVQDNESDCVICLGPMAVSLEMNRIVHADPRMVEMMRNEEAHLVEIRMMAWRTAVLQCGHWFHRRCLVQTLNDMGQQWTCPSCQEAPSGQDRNAVAADAAVPPPNELPAPPQGGLWMGNDIRLTTNAAGDAQIAAAGAGLPTAQERERETAMRDAAKAVFASERAKKGGADAAREAAKREAGRAESARANRLQERHEANLVQLDLLKAELAERKAELAEREKQLADQAPYVARLRAQEAAEQAEQQRLADEMAEREAEEERKRQRLAEEMAARQAAEQAEQQRLAEEVAARAAQDEKEREKKARKYTARSEKRAGKSAERAAKEEAEADYRLGAVTETRTMEDKPEYDADRPMFYELWARDFFKEPPIYSTLNMAEFTSYAESGSIAVDLETRGMFHSMHDKAAVEFMRALHHDSSAEIHRVLATQEPVLQSVVEGDTSGIPLLLTAWKKILDDFVALFSDVLKSLAPGELDTAPLSCWKVDTALQTALQDGLHRVVTHNEPLTGIPFLTAPPAFHVAALMQTARTAVRRPNSPSNLVYDEMTKVDCLITVYLIAFKICLTIMSEWKQIIQSLSDYIELLEDKSVADAYFARHDQTIMAKAVLENRLGPFFDVDAATTLLATTERVFRENKLGGLNSLLDLDHSVKMETFDTLFSTWVNDLVDKVLVDYKFGAGQSSSSSKGALLNALQERVPLLPSFAGGEGEPQKKTVKDWRVPLSDFSQLLKTGSESAGRGRTCRLTWSGLVELTAREYNKKTSQGLTQTQRRWRLPQEAPAPASSELQTEHPFFEGVLQGTPLNEEQNKLLRDNMPSVAFMYSKRFELRRHNWGHRYWVPVRNNRLSGDMLMPKEKARKQLRFANLEPSEYYRNLLVWQQKADAVEFLERQKEAFLLGQQLAAEEEAEKAKESQAGGSGRPRTHSNTKPKGKRSGKK